MDVYCTKFAVWDKDCAVYVSKMNIFVDFVVAEFASYQSLKFESISVEDFTFGKDQYVVFAQPFTGTCSFQEWDHVEMVFRTFDSIESE